MPVILNIPIANGLKVNIVVDFATENLLLSIGNIMLKNYQKKNVFIVVKDLKETLNSLTRNGVKHYAVIENVVEIMPLKVEGQ